LPTKKKKPGIQAGFFGCIMPEVDRTTDIRGGANAFLPVDAAIVREAWAQIEVTI
jgi:hypothetical protein